MAPHSVQPNRKFGRCCCCGRVIPPGQDRLRLTPQQKRVYDAIMQAPRTVQQLRTLLWGGLADRISEKHVHVQVSQANKRLIPHGLKIICVNRSYYLVDYYARPVEQRSANTDSGKVDLGSQSAGQASLDR